MLLDLVDHRRRRDSVRTEKRRLVLPFPRQHRISELAFPQLFSRLCVERENSAFDSGGVHHAANSFGGRDLARDHRRGQRGHHVRLVFQIRFPGERHFGHGVRRDSRLFESPRRALRIVTISQPVPRDGARRKSNQAQISFHSISLQQLCRDRTAPNHIRLLLGFTRCTVQVEIGWGKNFLKRGITRELFVGNRSIEDAVEECDRELQGLTDAQALFPSLDPGSEFHSVAPTTRPFKLGDSSSPDPPAFQPRDWAPAGHHSRRQPVLPEGDRGAEAGAETGTPMPLSNLPVFKQCCGTGPSRDQAAGECQPRFSIVRWSVANDSRLRGSAHDPERPSEVVAERGCPWADSVHGRWLVFSPDESFLQHNPDSCQLWAKTEDRSK